MEVIINIVPSHMQPLSTRSSSKLDGAELEARVMADPTVRERLDGRPVVKTIVVPDKLVNIVVKG